MESVNDSWKVDLVHHYVALVLSGSIGVDQFNNPVDLSALCWMCFVCSNGYHLFTKDSVYVVICQMGHSCATCPCHGTRAHVSGDNTRVHVTK